MTRVLVLNLRIPYPLDDGNALRVFELARHLDPDIECHLACLPSRTEGLDELVVRDVFRSVTVLPPVDARRNWRRFLRRGNRHYRRRTYPRHFHQAVSDLAELVARHRIDVVVSVLHTMEEYARALSGVRRVVDQYDCATLSIERRIAITPRWRVREHLRLARRARDTRAVERCLSTSNDLITAVSPADVAYLEGLNPHGRVQLIPNGVAAELLERPVVRPSRRGVAFWGNLSFSVNQHAIRFFYDRVWLPHLSDQDVELAIVGPNAPPDIVALGERHDRIHVAGFVDDLHGYLDAYPIMVNTMISGSGLKNKVVEAFASRKAVVSTTLGIEALPVADGVHCLVADDPDAIAASILRLLAHPAECDRLGHAARSFVAEGYTWDAVGGIWSESLRNLGGVQLR
jgi:glycosyltransferase involved in cell wall biosynthesis